jgi:hypothetical protein
MYKLYFVDFVKLKSILFLHTRSLSHILSLFLGLPFFPFFLTSGVVQRARPLINQEGCARAGQIPHPRQDGQSPDPDSSIAHGSKGGGAMMVIVIGRWAHSQSIFFLFLFSSFPSRFSSLLFSSTLLTSARSCNRHVPPIIQEGRARAGQIPQPRRDGQSPDPNSS